MSYQKDLEELKEVFLINQEIINVQKQYIGFLGRQVGALSVLQFLRGHDVPKEILGEGKFYREALEELQTKLNLIIC